MVPDPLLFTFALISSGALSFLLVYYVSLPKKKKTKKICHQQISFTFFTATNNYPYIYIEYPSKFEQF